MQAERLIETVAGIVPDSKLAELLAARPEVMRFSQASIEAVLTPRDPGGVSHAERAALAARMAHWMGDAALAARCRARLHALGAPAPLDAIAEGGDAAAAPPRLRGMVRHVDLVTRTPRDATRGDIAALKSDGVAEPDIVRLSELIAVVNYQARVIAGLRLLAIP